MEEKVERESESVEQDVFKALDHQKRRDILRYIGENKGVTFTEILNASKIPDSPILSYHLKSLAPFVEQKNGRYRLSPLGKDAYNLLLRTTTYNKLALLQKNKFEVTIGNSFIWGAAILAAAVLRTDVILHSVILPVLAAISLSMTYELFK